MMMKTERKQKADERNNLTAVSVLLLLMLYAAFPLPSSHADAKRENKNDLVVFPSLARKTDEITADDQGK